MILSIGQISALLAYMKSNGVDMVDTSALPKKLCKYFRDYGHDGNKCIALETQCVCDTAGCMGYCLKSEEDGVV